jgi:hypothetical protein
MCGGWVHNYTSYRVGNVWRSRTHQGWATTTLATTMPLRSSWPLPDGLTCNNGPMSGADRRIRILPSLSPRFSNSARRREVSTSRTPPLPVVVSRLLARLVTDPSLNVWRAHSHSSLRGYLDTQLLCR